ncbi:MAG: zeta toxin family protein [Neisseriaceae bacterium]|nr:zeta toxin family protein [Neisseriaceae bacterium]
MNDYSKEIKIIWYELLDDYHLAKPCVNPQGFVLGGQPGAGKSNLLKQIENRLNGNVLIINADEFRRYHPQFDEIQAQYGDDAPKHTAEFSGKMAERVLNKALTEHYNIAIEGTFRTAETPLNTLDLMKSHGYKTAVHIQTCPKSLSWQSTIKRYNAMIKAGLTPRAVDKAHHDLVCDRLPENADTVYQSGKADEFQVYSRNGLIFDSKTSQNLPSKVIHKELHTLTQEEAQTQMMSVFAEFAPIDSPAYKDIEQRVERQVTEHYKQGKVLTQQDIQQVRENTAKTMPQVRQDYHQAAKKQPAQTPSVEQTLKQQDKGNLKR